MNKIWTAQWIQDPRFKGKKTLSLLHKELIPGKSEHPTELQNHHTFFRKQLILQDLPSQAVLDITADDYYKLYVNGRFVAQGPAQSYPFHYFYNQIDVLPYLQTGDNVVAVHVYYQGLINRSMNSGDLRQGLIAEMFVDDQLALQTDDSWKYFVTAEYGTGGTIGYDTQYLEHIDSRLTPKGWKFAGYNDELWSRAAVADSIDYCFVLQPTPALCVYEKKPASIKHLANGHYIIDFGTELTGQFTMKAHGLAGQIIEIRCGEELNSDGLTRYDLRCNCKYQEFWTLSGSTDQLDFFDYKAFRYVEVIGPEKAIDTDSFTAIVRHYPLDATNCSFESSDTLLNQIWEICRNGIQYGSQENFVDCPSREKGQYLGDNTVIGHSHLYVSGDSRLLKKALEDFARSSVICPGLMAVAPGNLMQEIADYSLQWPLQLWQYYLYSGDLDFLGKMLPYVEGVSKYFNQFEDEQGLLHHVYEKWNLVDWPQNLRDGYDFPLTKPVGEGYHNVINSFYFGFLQTVEDIQNVLGVSTQKGSSTRFKNAFLQKFYHHETRLFVDAEGSHHSSLHSNVLPLLFGLAPKESESAIVQLIQEKRFSCGVYFSYFVLKALAKVKEYNLIYQLITGEGSQSWANMIREGATTCFEAWGKEQKWNTSLCHPWASAPIPLLIEEIVGLQPAIPGWTEVNFTPHLPENLKKIRLSVTVPTGTIEVSLDQQKAQIQVPPGVRVRTADQA